jgi:thiamine biosynthesis lipoprotein
MLQQKKTSVTSSEICMDTVVTIHVISHQNQKKIEEKMVRAFGVFRYVETVCSRFTPESEVMRLFHQVGKAVEVSPVLFEALKFSLEVAKVTNGAFDPTVGQRLETYGFNQSYLRTEANSLSSKPISPVSFRDIELDPNNRAVLLRQPLVIDLGAVVKGLAIDLAAKELGNCHGFYINAGGDIYTHGLNEKNEPWLVGIEHPTDPTKLIGTVLLTDGAVCTSGLSKRRSPIVEGTDHIIHPKTGETPHALLSSTVVAPFAMLADTFSTAAFIKGPRLGLHLLKREGLDGFLVSEDFTIHSTEGMRNYDFRPITP